MNDLLKNKDNTYKKAGMVCREVIISTKDIIQLHSPLTAQDLIKGVSGLNHRHIIGMEKLGYIKVERKGVKIVDVKWNTQLSVEENIDLMTLHLFMEISTSKKVMAANAEITPVEFEDGPTESIPSRTFSIKQIIKEAEPVCPLPKEDGPLLKQKEIAFPDTKEMVATEWPFFWEIVPGQNILKFQIDGFPVLSDRKLTEFRVALAKLIESTITIKN